MLGGVSVVRFKRGKSRDTRSIDQYLLARNSQWLRIFGRRSESKLVFQAVNATARLLRHATESFHYLAVSSILVVDSPTIVLKEVRTRIPQSNIRIQLFL
jgi:hypothetical protein